MFKYARWTEVQPTKISISKYCSSAFAYIDVGKER